MKVTAKNFAFLQLTLTFSLSVFANDVSGISLVSGSKGYLMHVQAMLKDAQVSYELKGDDLMFTVKSPNITAKETFSSVKQLDAGFIASSMATKVYDGLVQILLKEYKLPASDIITKQTDNGILFYLGPNKSKNSAEYKTEIGKKETEQSRNYKNAENGDASLDSVALVGRDGYFSLYLYGKFPSQVRISPSDSGFFISYPDKINLAKNLGKRYNFSKESIFSYINFSDSSLFVKTKKGGASPLFVSSIPSGAAIYFKDNRQLASTPILSEKIRGGISSTAVFIGNSSNKQQIDTQNSNVPDSEETILFVSKNKINLRKAPSANAEVAAKAMLGDKLVAIKKQGSWYAVKNRNGATVWVREDLVDNGGQSAETQKAAYVQNSANFEMFGEKDNHDVITEGEYIVFTNDKSGRKPQSNPQNNVSAAVPEQKIQTPSDSSVENNTETNVKKIYVYHKRGRDPFLPLDKSDFIREGLPSVTAIKLVGILYDKNDAVALFEETKGAITTSFSMKVGDPIVSGKLLRIEPDKVVFLIREATFSYTVEKELNFN